MQLLTTLGISKEAAVAVSADVTTLLWWSASMEDYAKALATGQSIEDAGKHVVTDSTRGFSEPWMVLAAWNMLAEPAIDSGFTPAALERATGAAK